MAIKVGDKVIVIAGSNKGKEGTVKKVLREENLLGFSTYTKISNTFLVLVLLQSYGP